MKKNVRVGFLIGALILAVVLTFNLTYVIVWHAFTNRINNLTTRELTFGKIAEISTYIDEFYIGDYDEADLLESVSDGCVNALRDISSYYLTREEVQARRSGMENGYTSIGIISRYDKENGGVQILRMYEGSPALEQGISVLDTIVAVDGLSVSAIGYEAALEKLRGEEGTEVALTVYRQVTGERFHTIVRRGAVVNDPETPYRMLPDRIGYIELYSFSEDADKAFAEALRSLREQGMEKLVIDLRLNPGGHMDVMSAIADQFLEEGSLIYQTRDYSGSVVPYPARGSAESLPIALLVDEYTAGAAEYFAAALSENGRAKIVGTTSAGIGYAQSSIELSDGSQLILSTTEYLTAHGASLQGVGLHPDVDAADDIAAFHAVLTQDAEDAQLEVACTILDE